MREGLGGLRKSPFSGGLRRAVYVCSDEVIGMLGWKKAVF